MSTDAYHNDHSHVTRSALRVFMQSRRDFYDIYVAGSRRPPSPSCVMLEGKLLHAVLIEGKAVDSFLACYPKSCLKSDGSLNSNPAKQFRDENEGRLCVKVYEMFRLMNVLGQVQRHPLIAEIVSDAEVARETEITADINGIPCKAKPDLMWPDRIIDLKCMDSIDPASFIRSAKRLAYWLQDAHYTRCARSETFVFRCIETSPPFRVHDYRYDLASRQLAFDAHDRLLNELRECRETGDWSEKWPDEIAIKPWEIGAVDDDELVTVEGEL